MSWEEIAACRGTDPEAFFPEAGADSHAQTRQALAICEKCPVATECWWDEITGGQPSWGIRGGQKPSELNAARVAYEQGGSQRPAAEAAARAQEKAEQRKAAEEAAAIVKAAEVKAGRESYLTGRTERQREASRKYAANKRAREREERQAAAQMPWDVPEQRQPERDQDVAEVA